MAGASLVIGASVVGIIGFPCGFKSSKDRARIDSLTAQLSTNDRAGPWKIKVHAIEEDLLEQLCW
jgi:hypothetical protein